MDCRKKAFFDLHVVLIPSGGHSVGLEVQHFPCLDFGLPQDAQNRGEVEHVDVEMTHCPLFRDRWQGLLETGLFKEVHFLEILENVEILESPHIVENKGGSQPHDSGAFAKASAKQKRDRGRDSQLRRRPRLNSELHAATKLLLPWSSGPLRKRLIEPRYESNFVRPKCSHRRVSLK